MTDDVDLSTLPITYLESYPFPAFVLVIPTIPKSRPPLISRDTDITVRNDSREPLSPLSTDLFSSAKNINSYTPHSYIQAWGNTRWVQMTDGAPMSECVDSLALNHLQSWVESEDEDYFTLELRRPQCTLLLTKTLAPMNPPSRTKSFCIVTSVRVAEHFHTPSGRSSVSTDTSYFPPPPLGTSLQSPPIASSQRSKSRVSRKQSMFEDIPGLETADIKVLLEEVDWSKTSLGPKSSWPAGVQTMLNVISRSTTDDALWLGVDYHLIYNQNYVRLVDHPNSFGKPAKEVWPTLWDQLKPFLDKCRSGEAHHVADDLLFYKKHGRNNFVEKYHTWSYIPVIENGQVFGVYNPSTDTTDNVLAKRRLNTTRDLSEQLLVARTQREYFESITEVLGRNTLDAPFAICYSVQDGDDIELTLQTTVGVPHNHPAAPAKLSFPSPNKQRSNFGPNADRLSSPTLSAISALSSGSGRVNRCYDSKFWPIAKALTTRQIVLMDDCRELIQGFPVRQWDNLPDMALVVPICSETSLETPSGVLILGLNLFRPFDSSYEDWIQVLRAQLTSSLSSVKAYEAEADRIAEREKLERAKQSWFQGVAHDLRSPLTLIFGPLDDVLKSTLTPKQKSAVSTALRNVNRLQRLVNNLLDFSRLEAGRMEGRFVPIHLGNFVTELANLFKPAIERMGLEYRIEIEPNENLVYIDPTLLETMITNLLGNALKYTDHGFISIKLSYNDMAQISISDSGFGIPKAELGEVTDRFHRASTALSRGTEGTGIGLALAKEIVRLHAGEFIIESKTAEEFKGEHGSTFTARIPLTAKTMKKEKLGGSFTFGTYSQQVAKEALEWARDEETTTQEGSSDGGNDGTSTSGRSDGFLFEKTDVLLIADDSNDMRAYIKNLFTPYCKVIEARDGKEALKKAIEFKPTLVLSDLMMPELDGLGLLAAIRAEPTTRLVPMVLLSAATDDELRFQALIEGAEDFLTKPFKSKELVARVHLHMQMGKKRVTLENLFTQREQEIAVLSDYCPSGIMRADKDGSVIYANASWKRLAGMPSDGDLNTWPQYCDEETRIRLAPIWKEILYGDQKESTVNWKWANGRSMTGVFIRLDKIRPDMSGIIGCLTDLTLQEEQLLEAERRRIEAEESKHQQELLVDLTSHEIRTPVSAILQCSSLVKENLVALKDQLRYSGQNGFKPSLELLSDLDEDVEALESIYQCGLVQERIAGDVLSLARIQLDMLSLHHVEMDLKKEAKKVLSVFASEAKMKRIELKLEFGESISKIGIASFKTDPVRLGQVVTNLISNSMRFTASSDVRRITIRFDVSFLPPADDTCALPQSIGAPAVLPPPEDTPVWLFVSVTDTGPGLGPHEQSILFQRFTQGNKMIHTRYGGSGLGLFICKKITELLGGRIEVKSQLGHGSCFRFFIQSWTVSPTMITTDLTSPLTSTTSSVSITPSSSHSSSPAPPSPSTSGTTTSITGADNLHILIVEDNIINQTVLKRQMVKEGISCDVANNGQEALDCIREVYRLSKRAGPIRKALYDVVLMDLEMPVMDGLTAIRQIRESEARGALNKQIVIALTGNARQGQIDQALAAGMDDVVIKPYRLPELIAKMRTAVATRRASLQDVE